MADVNDNAPAEGTEYVPTLDDINRQIELVEKYGDRPIEAALGSAASAATLGASDVIATDILGVPAERPRTVRELEPAATTLGAIGGTIGGALATGGSTTIAKAAGAGMKLATGAGGLAAKEVAKRIGAKGVAAKAAEMAARGAAEGIVIGTGEAVSDIALEKKPLSAETIAAGAGAGALLGAGFGGALGVAGATVPKITKTMGKLADKVKTSVKDKIAPLTDAREAAIHYTADTAAQRVRLTNALGNSAEELPAFYQKNFNLSAFDSPQSIHAQNLKVIERSGEQIDEIAKTLDNAVASGQVSVSRADTWGRFADTIEDIRTKLAEDPNINKAELDLLKRWSKDVTKRASALEPFSFKSFNDWRKTQLSRKGWKGITEVERFQGDVARRLYAQAREITDDIATKTEAISPNLASELKEANKTYSIAKTIDSFLEKQAQNASVFDPKLQSIAKSGIGALLGTSVGGPIGGAVGAAAASLVDPARMAKTAALKYNIAKQTGDVINTIGDSITKFFKAATKPAKPVTAQQRLAGLKVLTNTGFALGPDQKVPKNPAEAFENIRENIDELKTDEQKLIELLAKRTAVVAQADPEVALDMQQTLQRAIAFIDKKLPRSAVRSGAFMRPYRPSDMELSKFARYMQIIEAPLTVLQELENGTITREHVEALQQVYPALYNEIRVKTLENIQESPNMSYSRKIQLGILLNIPADSSLHPDNLGQLQESIAGQTGPDVAGSQPQGLIRAKGVDQAGLADREATSTQKLMQR